MASDSEITLIHKLVPEPHALPEGMRLADHAEYGRVVVSPEKHAKEYRIFYSDRRVGYKASVAYVDDSGFTFLDGEPNA